MELLDRIRQQLPQLPAAEQRVAQTLLTRPHAFVQAAINGIAAQAGVSQPTVIRFARSVGCSGLADLKLKLASSLSGGVPYVHASVHPHDTPAEIAAKVFDNSIAALLRCRNAVNAEALQKAIDLLAAAQRMEFYGLGNSGITAADAQHKFFRYGTPAVAYADPHVQAMSASVLGPQDVVVAISASGRSAELLDAVDIARRAGASVVAITASGSPLARRATVALLADAQEDAQVYSPMLSRLLHLVLIDVLAVGVALRKGPALIERLQRAKRSVRSRRRDEP